MITIVENRGPGHAVLGIGTAVPPYRLDQDEASRSIADALANHKDSARWAKKIFKTCGVENRYTCEPGLLEPADRCRYAPSTPLHEVPTTAERMALYKQRSVPLGVEAAAKALQDSGAANTEITHLITVSCTGLFLPGLDIALIEELELPLEVNRIPLTFMGCAAGLTAIRLAGDIARHTPSAKILIVCVELCTLHIQPSSEREALYAAAFFGDGASACVVGTADHRQSSGVFKLAASRAVVFPGAKDHMVWNVGNYGFELFLSHHIPKLIGDFVPAQIDLLSDGLPTPELWAIHPGGRGIIDTLQALYDLTDEQTAASRSILRRFGNMSSATILFVLDQMRRELQEERQVSKEGIVLAFGPGLNAELMRMTYMPAASVPEISKETAYV